MVAFLCSHCQCAACRLKRAAPELLAALKELLDIVDQGDTSEVWQTALLKARVAVSQAEGSS